MTYAATRSLLIVGAGFGQLPAIKAAKALGLRTISVDRDPAAPGMTASDIGLAVDILDIDGVVEVARACSVGGAMTMQSDIGVPTVGAVVDALDLPGCGRTVADRCSNKILTRRCFEVHGVPQPGFFVVASAEEAAEAAVRLGFPCVVKPPDSSGSRGVVKVDCPAEMEAAFVEAASHASVDDILVEEHIPGIELGAQAFSLNGRCAAILVHDDAMSDPPAMVPIGHSFPSSLAPETLSMVRDAVTLCVEALGVATGPSNIDLILGQDRTPYVLEVGARIGATCLPELVQYHTGIDWVEAAVQAAWGETPTLETTRSDPCAAYVLQAPRDGVLRSYTLPDSVTAHPDVLEVEVTARPGEEVHLLRKGTDRIGKIVTRGGSRALADELARSLRSQIHFEVG